MIASSRYSHIYAQTYLHIYVYIYTHAYIYTFIRTHIYHIHTYMIASFRYPHTDTQIYIHTYVHVYVYIHICMYVCICIHICMYVCICIYITYICTWSPPSRDSKPYTLISQLVNDLNPCSKKKWRVQRACYVEHLNLYQIPFYLYWRSLLVRCPLAPY